MNVLSLCDGMSGGQQAFELNGITFDGVNNKYFASEIEPSSIKVTQHNFPNTIQIGDMTKIKNLDQYKGIDVLLSGTPCKSLSRTNTKQYKEGLDGSSKLFYDFVDIKKYIQPKYFLFENVESMSVKSKDIISELLEVEPIMINSALFSAQNRKRLYWTNIPINKLPKENNLVLKDILLPVDEVEEKYWYKNRTFTFHGEDKSVAATLDIKGHDILKRVSSKYYKSPTLTACRGGNLQKKVYQDGKCRKLTPLEYERLQTVKEGYTACVSDTNRYNMLGDGWTINVIAHILKVLC